MQKFGGDWTKKKIQIVVKYTKAYLKLMNSFSYWKLLYFDGFAGTGEIYFEDQEDIIEGVARKILSIDSPKSFDMYYFVEKKKKNAQKLNEIINQEFPHKKEISYVKQGDCNEKLQDMANFLRTPKGKNFKVLAFIDPCGMQVNFSSIAELKDLGIDMWILTPIGIGPNRLLKRNRDINLKCMDKLVNFLGMRKDEIHNNFYIKTGQQDLINGEKVHVVKTNKPIEKLSELYCNKLKGIFNYVSKPFVMKNKKNNPMYHFLLGSNNETAIKIANNIINKRNP